VIANREAEKYETVWSSIGQYGELSPGLNALPVFLPYFQEGEVVLDAGCGSGKTGLAAREAGVTVEWCDLTGAGLVEPISPFFIHCLWDELPRLYDHILCCDVMEHIPTEYVMLVLHRLIQASKKTVCLSIGLMPDNFGAYIGQPLHLTVQEFTWWRDRLKGMTNVIEARDCGAFALFVVEGQCLSLS
jgi:hypothetical protein